MNQRIIVLGTENQVNEWFKKKEYTAVIKVVPFVTESHEIGDYDHEVPSQVNFMIWYRCNGK